MQRHISTSRIVLAALAAVLAGCSADRVATPANMPSSKWIAEQREIARGMMADTSKGVPALVYIDGKQLVGTTVDPGYSMINPDRIATIRVLDGADVEELAGRPVPNGLIWITTKQADANH